MTVGDETREAVRAPWSGRPPDVPHGVAEALERTVMLVGIAPPPGRLTQRGPAVNPRGERPRRAPRRCRWCRSATPAAASPRPRPGRRPPRPGTRAPPRPAPTAWAAPAGCRARRTSRAPAGPSAVGREGQGQDRQDRDPRDQVDQAHRHARDERPSRHPPPVDHRAPDRPPELARGRRGDHLPGRPPRQHAQERHGQHPGPGRRRRRAQPRPRFIATIRARTAKPASPRPR